MVLHKTSINKRVSSVYGFTLFEILIVMAMMSILAGLTVFFSQGYYAQSLVLSEQTTLVVLLQTVRSEALQNKNNISHGLAIDPVGFIGYVLFEGTDLLNSDTASQVRIPRTTHLSFSSSTPTEVVFSQVSGESNWQGTLVLMDSSSGASTTITSNYEGAIY
jgi:prepilin-type N-terminal cleavage/methylation domain-containing protein